MRWRIPLKPPSTDHGSNTGIRRYRPPRGRRRIRPRSPGPATSDASVSRRRGRPPTVPSGAGARDSIRSCYVPLSCFRYAHDGSIMRGLFRSVSSHPGDSSIPGACPGFNHPTVCVPRETNGWQVQRVGGSSPPTRDGEEPPLDHESEPGAASPAARHGPGDAAPLAVPRVRRACGCAARTRRPGRRAACRPRRRAGRPCRWRRAASP